MLINNILYTILVSLLTIAVLWGVSWFIRKKLKNSQSFVIGFFIAGVFFIGMMYGIGRLYIISEKSEVQTYRAFGTFSYQLDDGNEITRTFDPDSVMIINNSFNTLRLEEIIYTVGGNGGDGETYVISPWTCVSYSLPGNRIYYFFSDEVDRTIDAHGKEPESRYWLHDYK